MKRKGIAILGLAAMLLIGGSFAYFTSTLKTDNKLTTDKFGAETIEEFNPGGELIPGAVIKKSVGVTNTGDYSLVARIKYDETWTRKGEDVAYQTNTSTSENGGNYTVVDKKLNLADWTYGGDGYYYYLQKLESGANSPEFLSSVSMKADADLGTYNVIKYYTEAATKPASDLIGEEAGTQWVKYTDDMPVSAKFNRTVTSLDDTDKGYADSDYLLSITTEVTQSTKGAVAQWMPTEQAVVAFLATLE